MQVKVTPFRYRDGALEVARNAKVTLEYDESPVFSTLSEEVPALTDAQLALHTNAIYAIVAAPDLYEDFVWYAERRRAAHPELTTLVVNCRDIYAAYPYGDGHRNRNAAESVHEFVRNQTKYYGLKYLMLGGMWFDAQKDEDVYYYTGERVGLETGVPGIRAYPSGGLDFCTDMFYACHSFVGQRSGLPQTYEYPWDANGDGVYLDKDDKGNNDVYPQIAVSRMALKPYKYFKNADGSLMNRHQLITNFVAKLERGEAENFNGRYKYGMLAGPTGYKQWPYDSNKIWHGETEWYDFTLNQWDWRNVKDWVGDTESSFRRQIKDFFATYRPVMDCHDLNYTQTRKGIAWGTQEAWWFKQDREFVWVTAHGWAQGADGLTAENVGTGTGLTLFIDCGVPCHTGNIEYRETSKGTNYTAVCVGDAAICNPNGGALTSMNNDHYGVTAGGKNYWDSGYSSTLMQNALFAFIDYGKSSGDSWLYAVQKTSAAYCAGTATYVLVQMLLFGDPYVTLPQPADAFVADGGSIAEPVNDLTIAPNGTLNITNYTGAVRLYGTGDVVLDGGEDGELRVGAGCEITNGTLTVKTKGGIGNAGVTFVGTPGTLVMDGPVGNGDDDCFYVGALTNCETVVVRGSGAKLDWDNFEKPTCNNYGVLGENKIKNLIISGRGKTESTNNVIRACEDVMMIKQYYNRKLRSFDKIAVTNAAVKFETHSAFKWNDIRTKPAAFMDWYNAAVTFGQNPYRGYPEKKEYLSGVINMHNSDLIVDFDQNFNFGYHNHQLLAVDDGVYTYYDAWYPSVFNMTGTNTFQTIHDGQIMLCGTNTVHLTDASTRFILAAKMDESKGSLYIDGAGTLEIPTGANFAGKIIAREGTSVQLDSLPLSNTQSLTMDAGSRLILPESDDGFYQVLPISSTMALADGVEVYAIDDLSTPLPGIATTTGAFFDETKLLKWNQDDGIWMMGASTKPWLLDGAAAAYDATKRVYFPDVDGKDVMRVQVGEDITCEFCYFGNAATKYAFRTQNVLTPRKITFASLLTGGETDFTNRVESAERIDVQASRLYLEDAYSPIVNVNAGATLAFAALETPALNWAAGGIVEARGELTGTATVAEGAILKAVPGTALSIPAATEIVFDGKLYIDTSALTLSAEPITVISGERKWTAGELVNFRCSDDYAEVRVNAAGEICVIAGENLTGPYSRTVVGEETWNTLGWNNYSTAEISGVTKQVGGVLPKIWSESVIKWYESGVIYATDGDNALAVDTPVTLDELKVCTTNEAPESFALAVTGDGSFTLNTLDLSECSFPLTLTAVALGDGQLLAGTVETRLNGGGGKVKLPSGDLVLDAPAPNWTLDADSQGRVVVTTTDAYKGGKTAFLKLAADFVYPSSSLSFSVEDGFEIVREGDTLYLSSPSVRAYVTASPVDFSALAWEAYDGTPVTITDWSEVKMAELIVENGASVTVAIDAAPVKSLTLSGTGTITLTEGGATLPGVITVNTATVINGEVLPELTQLGGTAELSLAAGARVNWDYNAAAYIDWTRVTGSGFIVPIANGGSLVFTPDAAFAPACPTLIDGITVALGDRAGAFIIANGSRGTLTRNVGGFTFNTELCGAADDFTVDGNLTVVATMTNSGSRWTTQPVVINGKLCWANPNEFIELTATAETDSAAITWPGVSKLTMSGAALTGVPAVADTELAAAPVGSIAFTVGDLNNGTRLIKLADDFTYVETDFHVTVARDAATENTDDWSWAIEDGYLVYRTHAINEVRHGAHFDGDLSEYGAKNMAFSDSFHSGNARPSIDPKWFVTSGNGKARFGQNIFSWGGSADLSGGEFSIFWVVRASETVNAAHIAIGSKSTGGLTIKRTANGMALVRYDSDHTTATNVVEATVTEPAARFHNYLAVYRNRAFRFYVDGEFIGEAADPCADGFKSGMPWQFYSVSSGGINGAGNSAFDGCVDEFRVYDWALEAASVKHLNALFPVWPEYDDGPIHVADGETYEIEMERAYAFLYGREVTVDAGGTLILSGGSNIQLQAQDLSNISGEGTVVWQSNSGYMSGPGTQFAETLSLEAHGQIPLSDNFSEPNAWTVRNLSGDAVFRSDYGTKDGKARQVKSVQTTASEFRGSFAAASDGRTTALIVAGDASEPSILKALTLSGTESAEHKLTIESTGCAKIAVNENWLGEIVNDGILIIAPPTETEFVATNNTWSGSGTLVLDGSGTLDLRGVEIGYTLAKNPRGILRFEITSQFRQQLIAVEDGFDPAIDGFTVELVAGGDLDVSDWRVEVRDGFLWARPGRSALKLLVK